MTYVYLRGNLWVCLATQPKSLRKFNLRSTCVHLRLLAGPFRQDFRLWARDFYDVIVSASSTITLWKSRANNLIVLVEFLLKFPSKTIYIISGLNSREFISVSFNFELLNSRNRNAVLLVFSGILFNHFFLYVISKLRRNEETLDFCRPHQATAL